MLNSFGENIRKYRFEKNLTQQGFAEKLVSYMQDHFKNTDFDYSYKSISKWESGSAYPSLDVMIAVSGLIDKSLDELLKTDIEKFSALAPKGIDSLSRKNKKLLYELLQIDFQYDEKTETYYVLFDVCLRFNKNDATMICHTGKNLIAEKCFAWSKSQFREKSKTDSVDDIIADKLTDEFLCDLKDIGIVRSVSCSTASLEEEENESEFSENSASYFAAQINLGLTHEEIVNHIAAYTNIRLNAAKGDEEAKKIVFKWNE